MRKTFAAVILAVAALAAPRVFAYDCLPHQYIIGPGTWYEYNNNRLETSDTTCWTLGSTSPTWNSTAGMWQFVTWNDQTATRSFTVGANDPGTSSWSAQLYVDFNDPNASWWNAMSAEVDVLHNGSHSYYTIYSILGNGGVTSDSGTKSVNFTAVNGDTITVRVKGRISYTNSYARFRSVYVFRQG